MANLIRENWANLDSEELRLLLNRRIGRPGQVDSAADPNKDKLYLPCARESCRVALTFNKNKVVAIEPGQAFDAAEWDRIASEIENSILIGPAKIGREYSFSSFRVIGSWRGARSGVQILPPSPNAPRPSIEIAEHPFILEFPIVGGPDDLFELTNHRRRREHRRMTLLLNVLLTGRVSCEPRQSDHFWAFIPHEPRARSRFVERLRLYFAKIRSWLGWPPSNKGIGESRWLQRYFCASLDAIVSDDLSPPAAENLTEIDRRSTTRMSATMENRCVYPPILMIQFAAIVIFRLRIAANSIVQFFGWTSPRVNGLSLFHLLSRRWSRRLKR